MNFVWRGVVQRVSFFKWEISLNTINEITKAGGWAADQQSHIYTNKTRSWKQANRIHKQNQQLTTTLKTQRQKMEATALGLKLTVLRLQDYKLLILKPLNFKTFMIYLLLFNHLMAFALAAVCLACNLCWWPCHVLLYVSWFHLLSSSFLHNVMTVALAPIKKTCMNVEIFRSSNWRSTCLAKIEGVPDIACAWALVSLAAKPEKPCL